MQYHWNQIPEKIFVAPREIHDLIQRASRVKGCEASVAERIASKITFCEINYGGGIGSWLNLVTDDESYLAETFQSVQVLDSLPVKDSLEFYWHSPIPFSFIAQPLNNLQSYGFNWEVDNSGAFFMITDVGSPFLEFGDILIQFAWLNKENSGPPDVFPRREDHSNVCDHSEVPRRDVKEAFSEGTPVNRREWEELVNIAAGFLLSEKILDDAHSAVYE